MGKDDKRRKGAAASSSRAAELLQSSGLGIQFLSLGNDPSSLEFPSGNDDNKTDEFADVDSDYRIAFRKLSKKEAGTREKGLNSLADLVQKADSNSTSAANGIRHFVKFYNYLAFDSVSSIRSAANDTLAVAILKLRKQIAEHIVKMLPSTLIAKYDSLSAVRHSADELLEKCFNDEQRKKIYDHAAPRAIKVCLQIIQKKNTLVNKQKYSDDENLDQRVERIVVQALTALGELSSKCPDQSDEILSTVDGVYDSLVNIGPQVSNAILLCFLQMVKDGHIVEFTRTNASYKILKFLHSDLHTLCKNAFGIYLFMAEAKANDKIQTSFSKKEFINDLTLRMVTLKTTHYNALQEFLLPLIIIVIKYEAQKPFLWILEVLDAFFEDDVPETIYLPWTKTFIDVSEWLYKTFLPANFNEHFANKLALSTLNFVQTFNEREVELPVDVRPTFQTLVGDFISRHFSHGWGEQNKVSERLCALLVRDLPSTGSTIGYILSNYNQRSEQDSKSHYFDMLAAKTLVDTKTPNFLFEKLIQLQVYKDNSQLDSTLLLQKLEDVLKGANSNDSHLECYKYLKGQQTQATQQKLSEIVDLNEPTSVSSCYSNFRSKRKDNDSSKENPWTNEFLVWTGELEATEAIALTEEFYDHLNLRLYAKLLLALTSSNLSFTEQQRNQLAISILNRLFTFEQTVDQGDFEALNKFLEDSAVDVKSFAYTLFEQLESSASCDLEKWFSKGSAITSLPYISNKMEPLAESFNKLTQFLDSTFSEQILLNETMLVTAALTENNYQPFDVDRCTTLIRMANTAAFYSALKTDNVKIQLYICLCYSILKLYINGEVVLNELGRQIDLFSQYWSDCTWNMNNLGERFVYHLVESNAEIPFTILFTLRQLASEFEIENLADVFTISTLDNKQKLRAVSALSFSLPHELLPENEYLHFVNSLEKASQKVEKEPGRKRSHQKCFVVFSDANLRTSFKRLARDRQCNPTLQIIHVHEHPIRLLAILAAKFFIYYDINLNKSLVASSSDEQIEKHSKLEAIQNEWREFFGASMSNYLMAWFCWSGFTEASETERFPEFFRIQICKFVYNADPKLELFKLVHNPASAFPDVEKGEIFEMLVELLFSDKAELQLTAVQILHSELISLIDVKGGELDQETQMILALRDQEPESSSTEVIEQPAKDIEYKLYEFFQRLLERLQHIEWSNVNSLDPFLVVSDLLLRIVRLLDSKAAGTLCAEFKGETIENVFNKICSYINFNESPSLVKKFAQMEPALFFTLWKDDVQLDNKNVLHERLFSIENYACWLYRRSLESLPAVVREWFEKEKNDRLRKFTQQNISPILIANEMAVVASQDKTTEFSMRARPNTQEVYVKYTVDDVSLDFVLSLPDSYPLTAATIQQDKKTILSTSRVNALRKNLFAFLTNRNGNLLEGIDQWRRGVEKQVANVESCSICLMIVSSSNYKLPDMKCRQCKNKFHSDCMLKWIRTSSQPSCPLCRAEFC
ncbi:E3 ubiquitin-protein ligase listerin [Aphelenchoides bicaudatus]|nr:E3 ubiquitin-protein ligase listerin [Aphelenchoides bicaudatus]